MKKTFLILLSIVGLYSCKDMKSEYKTCLMKAANQYMVSGERASMDNLKEMCNHFDDDLKKIDIDEKNQIRGMLDSIMLNIETKTLFEGIDEAKLPNIPCAGDFKVEFSKLLNELPPESDDEYIGKRINYLFSKRPINCRALINTYYDRANDKIELDCRLYDEDLIYGESFRLTISNEHKDLIKPKTRGNFEQIIEFEGVFDFWWKNQYGYSGFAIDVTNFKLMDYE